MKKRTVRLLAIAFGISLLAIPGFLFGKQIIEKLITPTKTMYSGETEDVDMDLPSGDKAVDKEEYLRMRDAQIGLMRGLPLEKGNERTEAIRSMESKEDLMRSNNLMASASWKYLGPSPIPVTVPTSGRVSAIAVHPTNPDIAYVGTAQGGLYRTLNGGATWTPLLDNALTLAIGAVAIAPSDPTTVYVGTGEAGGSLDSFLGVGIYRITNADTAPVVSAPIGVNEFAGRSISELLVNPTDANTIFASSSTGSCGMGGCTGAATPSLGIYRSSNALSATPTFTKLNVNPVNAGNRAVMDMVMEPGVPDNIVCWVRGNAGAGDGGIYRSTNAMSASPTFTQTYTMVTNGSRGELAIQKTGNVVTVVAATGEVAGGSTQGAVFKSVDGGATFPTQLTAGNNFCNAQCFYDIAVAFDPTNGNTIYLAGSPNAVFKRSFDGGTTFTSSASGLHVDSHVITVAPSNPQIIYFGSDGGIYRSVNAGTNWSSLNNATFAATQFQSIALHPTLANYTLGGTQDNGTEFLANDGLTWVNSDGGDGGNVVIDQNATTATNVTAYHTYYNQTSSQIGFTRATTEAVSGDPNWSSFFGCGGTANGINCADSTLFYAPMVGGPGNPNTLYFGTNFLYRSANQGTTMTAVSQSLPSTLSAIAISPQDDNVRLVGLSNGTVWSTSTGSSTLTQMTGAFPARYVGRTTIDPSNSNTAYVTFAGYGVTAGAHVFKTTNLTAPTPTWSVAGNGIPDVPVDAFAVDPANSNNLFAGTDIGVYQSTDGGANWLPINNGQLPRVAVFDMAIQNGARVLRIATHGRGVWEYSLAATRRSAFDYDGDGKSDVSVYRPSDNVWYLQRSTAGFAATRFGAAGDQLVPADYTGDGKTDIAVFRPSNGTWYVLKSEDSTFYGANFGVSGDIPAPGDYDGDGKADFAVLRPGTPSIWYIQKSTAGFSAVAFGIAEDRPTIGDFDGDGKNDIAVYRPSLGQWFRLNSSDGSFSAMQFGAPGDQVVPGDYTGDGKTDIAVFRPSTSTWYVVRSETGTFYGAAFGAPGDIPTPGDYDGDGKTDFAVFRPSTGTWFELNSTTGFTAFAFGASGDKPTENSYVY
ncbi:MAG: FG-GAP-like repeat-containing protein [Acidobacteriota bacterium]